MSKLKLSITPGLLEPIHINPYDNKKYKPDKFKRLESEINIWIEQSNERLKFIQSLLGIIKNDYLENLKSILKNQESINDDINLLKNKLRLCKKN